MELIAFHSEGNTNICIKSHSNESNNCWYLLTQNYTFEPHGGAIGKVRGSPKLSPYTVCGL